MPAESTINQVNDNPFIEQFAQTIHHRRLSELALFVLDLGRPVAFVGGQLLWVAQPVLTPFTSADSVSQLAQILEQPAAIQQLSDQLTKLTAGDNTQ